MTTFDISVKKCYMLSSCAHPGQGSIGGWCFELNILLSCLDARHWWGQIWDGSGLRRRDRDALLALASGIPGVRELRTFLSKYAIFFVRIDKLFVPFAIGEENLCSGVPGTKATLFFFFSRLLGPRVCGRQKKKRKKKQTEHERVQVWVPLNTRGCLIRTPHGALKGTKAHTRTEKTRYTIPGWTIIHLM